MVDRCGSYNAAAECVINSDIASRDDNSELSEKERTDLVHTGEFSVYWQKGKKFFKHLVLMAESHFVILINIPQGLLYLSF